MTSKRQQSIHDDFIADITTRIACLNARGGRNPSKLNAGVVYATIALKAVGRALEATEDRAVRMELLQAQAILSSCLSLDHVNARTAGREVIEEILLEHIRENPGQRRENIAQALGIDEKALSVPIRRLVTAHKVQTRGEGRDVQYSTAPPGLSAMDETSKRREDER